MYKDLCINTIKNFINYNRAPDNTRTAKLNFLKFPKKIVRNTLKYKHTSNKWQFQKSLVSPTPTPFS